MPLAEGGFAGIDETVEEVGGVAAPPNAIEAEVEEFAGIGVIVEGEVEVGLARVRVFADAAVRVGGRVACRRRGRR